MPRDAEKDLLAGISLQPASSTAARVADALRTKILDGELPPGTQLREVPLSTAMNVSRNTVREALRLLAGEALTTHNLHRGVIVAQIRAEDVVDIFRVRRVLELQALEEVPSATRRELAAIDAAATACDVAADENDIWAVVNGDLAFHESLVALLRSERLSNLMRSSLAELRLALGTVDRAHGGMPELIHQHRQVVEAAADGKLDAAQALLTKHLEDAETLLLELAAANAERAVVEA